jgi:RNA polymerase sigma-70 factor (ECF subfamily)
LESIKNIVEGCVRMEHKYQKLVYERYFGFALKVVFRYIYRYEKAIDITNDGFVKLFRSFDSFDSGPEEEVERILMGYIKKIMINSSIDELRKNKMTPEIGGIPDEVWDMNSKTHEADQMMLYKDIILMIKKLPPQYRVVFNMYVIDGYNHLEIADIMKISVGTSKSSLSRARTILQKSLKKIEDSIACNM